MPILSAQGLRRSYGVSQILAGVDVSIASGERVGLVGTNGSGKSTLSRLLAGLEQPDEGKLALRRGARVGYLAQAPALDPDKSAIDEVLAGLGPWTEAMARYDAASAALEQASEVSEALLDAQQRAADAVEQAGGWDLRHRAERIMGHLRCPEPDTPIAHMSGGEKRRVALAQLLVSEPDLAILDEPTNHLDVDTIEWLEGYLISEFRGALLLITHDRYVLDRVASRTIELDAGVLHSFEGGYGAYLEAKALRQEQAEREEANRQNFLRRELQWLRQSPKARTTKQKARVERAEEALAVQAPKREKQAELTATAARSGKTVLELREVGLSFGERTLIADLDLFVARGERIGIVGPNGSGKTSLLRLIRGDLEPSAGSITLGKNTRIAYLDQTRSGLRDELSIYDNFDDGPTHIELGGQRVELRAYLRRFLFSYEQQRQPVASLSGGERTRVALAKLLRDASNLLMLDEPTNDLDVVSLSALEEMLLDYGGTLLLVSHDRWLLDRIATSVLAPDSEGRWVKLQGGYSDYRDWLDEQEKARAGAAKARPASSKAAPKARSKGGLTYAERIELSKLEERIETLEAAIAALETRLANPELYQKDPPGAARAGRDLEQARSELEQAMERWEALELKKEADA
ncbi:MAG: ABC-F family ATP-binding cassette domain-containing protein [Myxococcales bacterium]|nr:ABC-F family ATP-binding cassette domain-containing protein [Myxococcales bacterium]